MKRCKNCRCEFKPAQPMAVVCSWPCSIKWAAKLREKAEKAEKAKEKKADAVKRESQKTRPQQLKATEIVINKYVRTRDAKLGCVSCDRSPFWSGQFHASHFRSVGAAPGLRFHLWNIHKACSICNHYLSGNIAEYTPRLIAKIGIAKVEWLKSQNAVTHFDIDYLLRLKSIFSKKIKRLEKRLA